MSASEEGKARRVPLRGVGDMGEELSEEKGFDEVEALGDIHWLRNDRIPPPPKDGRRGGSGARGAVRAPRARRGATWLGNGSDRERPRSSACARAAASRASTQVGLGSSRLLRLYCTVCRAVADRQPAPALHIWRRHWCSRSRVSSARTSPSARRSWRGWKDLFSPGMACTTSSCE